jgi:hypothetical protein
MFLLRRRQRSLRRDLPRTSFVTHEDIALQSITWRQLLQSSHENENLYGFQSVSVYSEGVYGAAAGLPQKLTAYYLLVLTRVF